MQMHNIFEDVKNSLHFNKFEISNLLYVEYTCPITDQETGVWSQVDFIIHVLSGKKIWKTKDQLWETKKGDTLYLKKGTYSTIQSFDQEFCMIGFFINDSFVREYLRHVEGKVPIRRSVKDLPEFSIARIPTTPMLTGFINSMIPFFEDNKQPTRTLLELKFKELVLQMITSSDTPGLTAYLQSLINGGDSLPGIMENNFMYSHSLDHFAKLCNRSLSTFKRDFRSYYGTSPGKWIINRRLEHAAELIINTDESISRIAWDTGFEDTSHFSSSFKVKFGKAPVVYRHEQKMLFLNAMKMLDIHSME